MVLLGYERACWVGWSEGVRFVRVDRPLRVFLYFGVCSCFLAAAVLVSASFSRSQPGGMFYDDRERQVYKRAYALDTCTIGGPAASATSLHS